MLAQKSQLSIIGVSSPYVWEVLESARRHAFSVTCIDNLGGASSALPHLEVLGAETPRQIPFTLGLASAENRGRALIDCATQGFSVPFTLVDPHAVIASTTTLGHCVFVNAGAIVASNTSIGCATNINRSASIGHDNVLGFSVSVGPGAVLAGNITLADFVSVGAGATILPGISVGRGAVIGAGAVVTKDVTGGEVVAGNPARVIAPTVSSPADGATRATNPLEKPHLVCPFCDRSR